MESFLFVWYNLLTKWNYNGIIMETDVYGSDRGKKRRAKESRKGRPMRLEEMRDRKRNLGWSNETLAAKSGVPLATVQKVLSGITRNPRQKTVEALAAALRKGAGPAVKANMVREEAVENGAKRVYTMNDIRALPEDVRAELIDGKMEFMALPSRTHQRINGGMHLAVANCIRDTGRDCEIYIPPYGVFLHGDESEYFLPDLTVFCDHSKSEERGCFGAPDWIVEIVSPSSKQNDYKKKLFKYREAGVKLYWIIDPERKMTLVYQFDDEEETTGLYPFDEEVSCGLCPELKIRISEML